MGGMHILYFESSGFLKLVVSNFFRVGLQRSNPKKVANYKFQKSRTFKIEDVHSRFPYSKYSVMGPKITNFQRFRWRSIDKTVGKGTFAVPRSLPKFIIRKH